MGPDPFGGETKKAPISLPPLQDATLHSEKLEMVRRIVEDVAANDVIPLTSNEAEVIKAADLQRRSDRLALIKAMPDMGTYLVELSREKIDKKATISRSIC
jgi:hypothetical protein